MVASGRKLRPYAGIGELMEHDLVERGVPKDRVLRFAHQAEPAVLEKLSSEHFWGRRRTTR